MLEPGTLCASRRKAVVSPQTPPHTHSSGFLLAILFLFIFQRTRLPRRSQAGDLSPLERSTAYGRPTRQPWWSRWDSNPRPPGCKPGALPTELRPRRRIADRGLRIADSAASPLRLPFQFAIRDSQFAIELVGPGGVEPPTSPLSGARSKPTEL
jgi:hypothetical protein